MADGFIFNSETQLNDFRRSLPKLLNEQCPRDTVDWQLKRCRELLATKCAVLRYGLHLENFVPIPSPYRDTKGNQIPVLLWNAQLEEDKDPETFVEILEQIPKSTPFLLVILGNDPSNNQKWFTRLQRDFGERILHMGWCSERSDYVRWLHQASIVISTAKHETFGISIVESVYCGVLPLLPHRLSYPELLVNLGA